MVAVDLDNIVQYQPPATKPPCEAPAQVHDSISRGSAHSLSDTMFQVHQAPPYIPWSSLHPLPPIAPLQADTDSSGGLLSPCPRTEPATNVLDDALKEFPPRDPDGHDRAWTELDQELGGAEVMRDLGSTDSRNQGCLVGGPCGQDICHQCKTDHRDSHGQCRRMCTSYNTPERDQLNKEDVDQLEQCLLHDRAATDNMAVNEAAGVLKEAGVRTSRKGDRQDGVGVHANSLLDGPDLPITSINDGTNTMAGKPPASAFPETPPSNMPSSQSLGEDPGNTLCTTVPPPEDDGECGIQHDAGPRFACQAPSSGTPTAFHSSTLGQEERPSPCISIATLADLPLSTANTTDAPHSHSDSKVQLKDRGDPVDVSDSERQGSDDPDDDDYLEVQPDDGSDNDNPPRPRKRKRRVPERSPRRKHGITSFSTAAVADKPNADADVPLTSLHDVETIPIRGFLTRQVLLSKVVYSVTFEEQREHTCYNGPKKLPADLENRSTHPHAGAKRGSAKRPRTGILNTISRKDDQLLIKLKEQRELSWSEIAEHFPGRSKGSLQVRYSTRLKNRRVRNVANGLDVKTNSCDAARAPRARYGPSRTRRTVNRYSPS